MKKYIALLSACLMAVSACGCSDSTETDAENDVAEVTEEVITEKATESLTEPPTEPPTTLPPTEPPTEEPTLSEEEMAEVEAWYKEQCQSIPWKDIARDSEGMPGEDVTFTGQILQDCGDGFYRMATKKADYGDNYYEDVILVYYDIGDGDRILVDDIVTIWGTTAGLYTYETVMGDNITIPSVSAAFLEINS